MAATLGAPAGSIEEGDRVDMAKKKKAGKEELKKYKKKALKAEKKLKKLQQEIA
ncbi:hypothetical protein [Solemya velesiana gill symbiont]|uniref:hypothetical protein n=1 Tax=Solemya velesiana gill symbiont TaxID=1918948 RepID=UPI0015604FDE|nr:hypothetical protein [Solemya velesiana gill symbiont]